MRLRDISVAAIGLLLLLAWAARCAKGERSSVGEPAKETAAAASGQVAYETNPSEVRVEYLKVEIPSHFARGTPQPITLRVANGGSRWWAAGGTLPLRFGYHWADPERTGNWDSIVWDDGSRADLPSDVGPRQEADLRLTVTPPRAPNRGYKLVVAPLLEGPGGGWTTHVPYVADVDVR